MDGSEFHGVGFGIEVVGNKFQATGPALNIVPTKKLVSPSKMIIGARYVLSNVGNSDVTSLGQFGVSAIGDVFTYTHKVDFTEIENTNITVLPTDYSLYFQKDDGSTTFAGYPYTSTSSSISIVNAGGYSLTEDESVFLFVVKNGTVEGEKMKGQYMMTTLSTGESGSQRLSRYKFNLYAANADVDKSELSNK